MTRRQNAMLRRRDLLCTLFGVAALRAQPAHAAADVPGYPRPAFDAKSLAGVLAALNLRAPEPSTEVQVHGPELFEDGRVVPVSMACSAAGVRQLLLGVENNPFWLSAIFEPSAAVAPRIATRIKMRQTSKVVALAVLDSGRVLRADKAIEIVLGGCGGAADDIPERAGQPTLIRLQPDAGGGAIVRALLKHQMESGQRTDAAGRLLPAWHIEEVTARLGGRPVLHAWWGSSIAKNPYLQFSVAGVAPGDRLAIEWADNHGERRSDEAVMQKAPSPPSG